MNRQMSDNLSDTVSVVFGFHSGNDFQDEIHDLLMALPVDIMGFIEKNFIETG